MDQIKKNPRKSYLKRLLKLIRWCHLVCKDLAEIKKNKYVKSLKFEPKLCSRDKSGCDCSIDRTKQNFFIIIDQLDAANLRVKVLNRYFVPLVNKVVEPDDSMPLHLVHNEHVSDIFDSGRNIIRIDWKQKKYRLLDYKSHYRKIHKCLFGDQKSGAHSEILLPVEKSCYEDCWTVNSLLEANDKFILVRSHADCFQCWTTPTTEQIDSHFIDCGHTSLATVLNNNIYLLKHNFEFYQINVDSKFKFGWMTVDRLKDFNFGNLLLTSSQAIDDKVFIIEKSTRTLFCYNVKTEKWSSIGRISNCDNRSADGQRESDRLLTFTSTFISMDTIASELG
ncbi:uncharacterized protein LOC107370819 [Tetranychus urticae]|uniref:uncharacterized protein LOC107370819 n=1 Tax=Tetranychus urticae TaxID=32264 RepID=UPI00077BFCA1|nr:uncharacterized protein LOC107370819 [Tetranychus urticae]